MLKQPTDPQWVCTHCFVHLWSTATATEPDTCHVGLHDWECPPESDENDPMHLFGDMHVTPGMLSSEHHEECLINQDGGWNKVSDGYECDCETREFSWSACDGCGSTLGGTRHAVTGWIKTEES